MSKSFTADEARSIDLGHELLEQLDSVRDVGVIGTGLAILGLVTFPFAGISVTSEYLRTAGTIPDRGVMNTFGLLATAAGCGLSLLALVGAMGCMRMRTWARPVMVIYAVGSLIVGPVGIGFLIAMIALAQSPQGMPHFTYRIEAFPVWVGCVVGSLYGAWVLWVMRRWAGGIGSRQ
ncbi:MAG: hypothetical protein JWM97_2554 [Phycisphaerales bacterium]|nr:hypothetical protein [Phycisphaerales bacterium]